MRLSRAAKHITLLVWCLLTIAGESPAAEREIVLSEGWHLRPSEFVREGGEKTSTPSISTEGWYPTPVPTTVLAALVRNKVYSDIWMGDNLAKIPSEQFKKSWWFRKEFSIPNEPARQTIMLAFDGIIYRANIWLNGKLIAHADTTAGVYRRFAYF